MHKIPAWKANLRGLRNKSLDYYIFKYTCANEEQHHRLTVLISKRWRHYSSSNKDQK